MRKIIGSSLMLFGAFVAAVSIAQVAPQTLGPNTVWGRLGISAGPGQAIPFSRFTALLALDNLCTTTGAVPVYNGSAWECSTATDATTASTAFGTLKQTATAAATGVVQLGTQVRERLTAARTYYVRTNGSDSNTCLADTAGGACLTIQHAIDIVLKTIDSAGYVVTIQIADGTYTGLNVIAGPMVGATAVEQFIILGNTTTPANVAITTAGIAFQVSEGADVWLRGVKVTSSAGQSSIWVTRHARLWFDTVNFGSAAAYQLWVTDFAMAVSQGNYTISAGAQSHVVSDTKAAIFLFSNTVTLSGTPAFSTAFANAYLGGQIESSGMTFSGAATGIRYLVDQGGLISTGTSGSITYFPGDANGSVSSRGVYDLIPAFRVHKNGTDQTGIVTATKTDLTWSTESFDTGSYFTSNAWTPPGGLVRLHAIAQFSAAVVDQSAYFINIEKDGSIIAQKQVSASGTGVLSVDIEITDLATGANVYKVSARGDGASNKTVSGNSALTWFEGNQM